MLKIGQVFFYNNYRSIIVNIAPDHIKIRYFCMIPNYLHHYQITYSDEKSFFDIWHYI